MNDSFYCPQCGEDHESLLTDKAFQQPDEIFELSYLDQYVRTRGNGDLCTLDESRYFLRGVIEVPFQYTDDYFAFGTWAEVSKSDHDLYVQHFEIDGSTLDRLSGRLANDIPYYQEPTLGLVVEIQLGLPNARPSIHLPLASRHPLALEQQNGMSAARHHEIAED